MANSNGWGDGAANNAIGWGQGANNAIGWGDVQANSWAGLTDISGAPTTDADAQAFITAAAITDSTQQAAINTLVTDLKGYNIWTKMKALYPFVGGTNAKHTWNLKNTAQFQISWGGGVTSSANGITGSVNGFGNTGLIPSTSLTNNSLNVTVYSRTNNVANSTEIGCSTTSFLPIIGLGLRGLADTIIFDCYDFSAHRLTPLNLDSRGFFHGNILTSTNQKVYKNGVSIGSNTTAQTQTQPTTQPIYILARNDSGTAANYSARNLAFASIGDGLTDTEAANFYTAVQAFQTTLGRQI